MSKSNKTGIYKYEPLWGEWYVDSLIGKGSFGEVYRIYKTVKGRRVEAAAKYISVPKDSDDKKTIYSSGLATDDKSFREVCDERAESMTDEINLMLGLKGLDNIVSYEDHIKCPKEDEIGWDIIIRMELLTSLDKYLENNDFYLSDVLRLGVDLCNAINSCHQNGITHRDVKIENIFVDKDGHFKLGDFGVSRMSSSKTTKGTITGTEEYMAPEMLKKEKYNNTVDIYSLGLVLYRLLNNKRMPFLPSNGRITISDVELAANKRLDGTVFPSPHYADEELYRIISKACAYDKHERYQNATEMAEDLEKVILSQDVLVLRKSVVDVPPVPPVPPVSPVEPKKKIKNVLILIVLLFLVLGLLIGGWFLINKTANAVTDITGLPETVSIVSGDSLHLKANVLPVKAEQVVVYSSSDETVVSVDETGKIIANSAGNAVITASAGDYSEQIEVSVASDAIPVEDIIVQENISMPVNSTVRINTKIIPENATYTEISYSSSNADVVSVDAGGTATAKSVGETEITVKVGDVEKTVLLKVEKIPVTDLDGLMSNIELEVGKSQKIEFKIVPEDATDRTVTFESSDIETATVDENGNIVAKKSGNVTITVTCDEVVKTVTVIVKEKPVAGNPTEEQPLPHVHSYGAVKYETVHPHKGYKLCSSCGHKEFTNDTRNDNSCTTCNPPHVHSYGAVKYETAHPHKGYKLCSSCGHKEFTNDTRNDNSCTTCNPPHVHSYSAVKYETAHPHKGYKLCSSCGHKEFTNDTRNDNSCTTCNPPHVHSYGAVKYETAHPHEGYKECSCGAIASANNYQKKSNCSQCYPCTHCGSTKHLTKNHPVCSDCGSKNHTTYEHDESDGWVTKLPSYVNESKYDIDYRTEYLYKTRETTTSSKSSKSGWKLYHTDVNEGSWSAWQDEYISETETRKVKTRPVEATYKTQYNYGAYITKAGTHKPCLHLTDSNKEVWTGWLDYELPTVNTPTLNNYNFFCASCVNDLDSSRAGGKIVYIEKRGGNKYCWYEYVQNEKRYFWKEEQVVEATPAHTEYSYKNVEYTYYFEKWTEDSNWSTTEKSVNDNRKLVETRTVYKWVLK